MFDEKSRYAGVASYLVRDHRGRLTPVMPPAPLPEQDLLGYHVLRQGQRLDHLAQHYLDNAAGFWRICALNGVMLPEALTEAPEIAIPGREK